ncbi:MAG: helix-turn-helix transcriptional regulator [Acidimicrobiia bacterium]|nr:helix-turn-helix transcriptional regulator [Acidimicrobiia bacterium]MDQ3461558.1 helix-turn-helix domain-containing protein [Actinomycetota bacterium]
MQSALALRHARRAAGLTQRELARRAGVPQSTVARIEGGDHQPLVSTLDRLLQACGRSLDVSPLRGAGIDRTLIHALLALSPTERVQRAVDDAAGLARLGL